MINLESESDIKTLMNFAKIYSEENKSSIDESVLLKMSSDITEIKSSNAELMSLIISLTTKVQDQEEMIQKLQKHLKPAKVSKTTRASAKRNDIFKPYQAGQNPYNLVVMEEEKLIHIISKNGQKMQSYSLPVNVFELLSIIERINKNHDVLYMKDANEFCDLFGLNKQQFSKIYYNIGLGTFDGVLTELNKMIQDSSFSIKNGYIFRNGIDTKISRQTFYDFINIYVNSDDQFLAICKLIHERRHNLNGFDIFTVLKSYDSISKIFGEEQ